MGRQTLFPLTTSATSATKHGPLPQVQWAVRVHAQPSSGTIPAPAFFHTPKATCGLGGNRCPGQGLGQGDTDQTSSSPVWIRGSFPRAHESCYRGERKAKQSLAKCDALGTSLEILWLGPCTSPAGPWVRSLVREFRSHKPH